MDGTLVDSQQEVFRTIEKSLKRVGVSIDNAQNPLRIGPPVKEIIRTSFPESILSEEKLDETVKAFRQIYDSSMFVDTVPFPGIDEMIRCDNFIHHVITNKPDFATRRIMEMKGWTGFIKNVLSPDTLQCEFGRVLKKLELFQFFKDQYPAFKALGIGDMAGDVQCANAVGYESVGVLWGTGTWDELVRAGANFIVSDVNGLIDMLNRY
ncbi:MAG TPA: HAD hydrolase-like protein [Bacteroidales bacterium]|jgi:phosphoglycolate phosphatase|nr:HAD hydrolase-like protein [Bacteroidales bacterium]